MRPVRLELQGFAAFREPTIVDFEDVDLFALVGRTGSGKSTIVDAICFVLYGCVPRLEDRRQVGPVISAGALEAKVSLTFEVEGTQYIAVRVVRRDKKGKATTKEARLEPLDGEPLAGTASELDPAVEQLLGLSFDHFTRSVVLPQGEFQRFLHDKPRDRQGLLVDLLGLGVYEHMMQRANQLAAEHDADITRAEGRLEELEDCTVEERDAWKAAVKALGELRQQLREARPELTALLKETESAGRDADAAGALLELLGKVKVPPGVRKLAEDHAKAVAGHQQALSIVEAAVAATARREKDLAALPDRDPLVQARDAHTQLAKTRVRLEKAQSTLEKTQRQAEQTATKLKAAGSDLTSAQAALEELQREHAAHEVARGLRAGEPCPVCEQVVTAVPRRRAPTGLAAAKHAVTELQNAHENARKREMELTAALSAERRALNDLLQSEQEIVSQIKKYPDEAQIEVLLTSITAATDALKEARAHEKAARDAASAAQRKREAIESDLRKAERVFREQRDQLVAEGADVPPEHNVPILERWSELSDWASIQAAPTKRLITEAEKRAQKHEKEYERKLGTLRAAATELEVTIAKDAGLDELIEVAIEAEKDAKDAVKEIEAGIKERKILEKRLKQLAAEAVTAKELGHLLRADGFERWLLAEAFETLIDGASARLLELSGGQYSFTFNESNRDFLIVDHGNAGELRSARTLSGGETFQAALALALSLSDHLKDLAAEGAARIDAIFLDEGFGSLDPETLDTVATTIENLGAGDRMVGVITHVSDLAERLPIQYKVAKVARGSTIEKVIA